VEGTQEHGIATIWDADVLIWAASQIVEARDAGLRPSRLMRHALRDPALHRARHVAARLPAPQGRAGSAAIDHGGHVHPRDDGRRLHRFSWINEWKELADASGTPLGIELILPDWFYAGVLDAALVLTIDPAYFRLTGGIERWLYRLVRKHGGKQEYGWQFDFRTCTANPAARAPYDFACDLRALVARQSLPGYVLGIERMPDDGMELLTFRPVPHTARG
jgi:plasmid replication initiation protein